MKLSLLQENLNQALSNVSRFISTKNQLPILNNILFQTDNGRLKLSATNLELALNYWIGAKIEQEGSITIPSKEIVEFISYLPTGKLDLSLNKNNLLEIVSPKAQSTFATSPIDDFPDTSSKDKKYTFTLESSLLLKTIEQISFAAATDDSRPILTATLWQIKPDSYSCVTTDGFRLSLKQNKLVNVVNIGDQDSVTFLVPTRGLVELARLAKNSKTIEVGLTKDERQLVFVLEDLEVLCRLIEGDYPDYNRIIPDGHKIRLSADKEEFAQALRIASVFARESANVVKFLISKNKLELTANAPQVGQNKTFLDVNTQGGETDLHIAFNYKFVSDFVNACQGDNIVIELTDPLSPANFLDESDPNFTHIIMPVRLQD